jgi:hypothetical protein
MVSSNTVVVMTTALQPSDPIAYPAQVVKDRREQYRRAASFWAESCRQAGAKLVILDCTGASATDMQVVFDNIARRTVSFYTYAEDPTQLARGKGAVEASALDSYIDGSSFDSGNIFKVTGRLIVKNAVSIILSAPHEGLSCRRRIDNKYIDTRFFGVAKATWLRDFYAMSAEIDDSAGRYLEHVMALRATQNQTKLARFAERPQFNGSSGTTGRKYRPSILPKAVVEGIDGLAIWFASRKQI